MNYQFLKSVAARDLKSEGKSNLKVNISTLGPFAMNEPDQFLTANMDEPRLYDLNLWNERIEDSFVPNGMSSIRGIAYSNAKIVLTDGGTTKGGAFYVTDHEKETLSPEFPVRQIVAQGDDMYGVNHRGDLWKACIDDSTDYAYQKGEKLANAVEDSTHDHRWDSCRGIAVLDNSIAVLLRTHEVYGDVLLYDRNGSLQHEFPVGAKALAIGSDGSDLLVPATDNKVHIFRADGVKEGEIDEDMSFPSEIVADKRHLVVASNPQGRSKIGLEFLLFEKSA